MKNTLFIILFLISFISNAQQKLTLDECYTLVNENYPLSKQTGLLEQKTAYEIDAINKGKLPKIDLNAQATYQSDVISLPNTVPGIESINKDQYKATLDINQIIYNGGIIDANTRLKEAQVKTQQKQVEVNIYQLKNHINQYFFSILLLQEKRELLLSKNEVLLSKIQEVKSGVKNGALLPASELVLEAETLKIKQQLIELKFENIKMLQNLSELISKKISPETILIQPDITLTYKESERPELAFYDLQNQQIEFSKSILSKSTLPKINAFGQAGYGNPGLNMLDNSFQSFYMVGLKANWNIFDWGKNRKDKDALDIAKELIVSEKETFKLNNKMELQVIESEINKIEQLLITDEEIIKTHENIVKSSDTQMRNGIITASEFLTEFTNLFEAKNTLKTHEVELSLAKSNYNVTKGK